MKLLVLGDSAAAGVGADRQADALTGQIVKNLAGRFLVEWTLFARTGRYNVLHAGQREKTSSRTV